MPSAMIESAPLSSRPPDCFVWSVRVYYEDTDSGGVVYYANYLRFMERARTEWLRALGFEQTALTRDNGVVFVVRKVSVEYWQPAVFNDLLAVTVHHAEIGRARITFRQTVERGATVLASGRVDVACVNTVSFKPARIPVLLRDNVMKKHDGI